MSLVQILFLITGNDTIHVQCNGGIQTTTSTTAPNITPSTVATDDSTQVSTSTPSSSVSTTPEFTTDYANTSATTDGLNVSTGEVTSTSTTATSASTEHASVPLGDSAASSGLKGMFVSLFLSTTFTAYFSTLCVPAVTRMFLVSEDCSCRKRTVRLDYIR